MHDKPFSSFLIINPFGIGDCLFTTPLLENLKEKFPRAKFYYLCNKKTSPVIAAHPSVSGVFVYERDDFVRAGRQSFFAWWNKYREFIRTIRKNHIDVAVDVSLNTQYGFFAWAAGIRTRIGLDYKNRAFFLTKKLTIGGYSEKHVAEYYLDLLGLLGITPHAFGLRLPVDEARKAEAQMILRDSGAADNALLIGVVPGAGASWGKDAYLKRWPAEKFSLLAENIAREHKATIVLFGDPHDKEVIARVRAGLRQPVIDLSGKTSLIQLAALLREMALVVTNDGGPLHIAEAVGTKTVSIFGPVSDRVYGPYLLDEKRHIVVKNACGCQPCYNRFRLSPCTFAQKCLTELPVEAVMAAVKKILQESHVSL